MKCPFVMSMTRCPLDKTLGQYYFPLSEMDTIVFRAFLHINLNTHNSKINLVKKSHQVNMLACLKDRFSSLLQNVAPCSIKSFYQVDRDVDISCYFKRPLCFIIVGFSS